MKGKWQQVVRNSQGERPEREYFTDNRARGRKGSFGDGDMNILVTGAAGYIGTVVTEELIKAGHSVIALDNLVKGHRVAVAPEAVFVPTDLIDFRGSKCPTHRKYWLRFISWSHILLYF